MRQYILNVDFKNYENNFKKYDTEELYLRVCEDYPNYGVSRLGEVFNIKTGHKLVPFKNTANRKTVNGKVRRSDYYLRVSLRKDNKTVPVYVHKLVAKAYLVDTGLNPDNTLMEGRHEINHKDHNRDNNRWDNLEWCDTAYNKNH